MSQLLESIRNASSKHPLHSLLKKHRIPFGHVAKGLGVSFSHLGNVLAGRATASNDLSERLEQLQTELESVIN